MEPATVAMLALGFTVIANIGVVSFLLGGLFQKVKSNTARIRDLEDAEGTGTSGHNDLKVAFADLSATVRSEIRHLQDDLDRISGRPATQRQTRGGTG